MKKSYIFRDLFIYLLSLLFNFRMLKRNLKKIRCLRGGILGWVLIVFFLLMSSISTTANAECFFEAGVKYKIDPLLLRAIAQVESSMNPQAIHDNLNGSEDIGIMQINSSHLKRLAKSGITREKLLADACLTVMVGAEILAGFIRRFGYTWRAVGAYNAGIGEDRDSLRKLYAIKVVGEYRRLKKIPVGIASHTFF